MKRYIEIKIRVPYVTYHQAIKSHTNLDYLACDISRNIFNAEHQLLIDQSDPDIYIPQQHVIVTEGGSDNGS